LALGGADGRHLIRASLLDMTPLPPSISVIRSMYDQRRDQLRAAFQNLVEVAKPTGKPKFVVAHILAPHPPFVFGPNGEPRRWSKGFQFVDGSHYMASGGTPESYRQGYADQATYLDKLVLEAVDGILRQSGPDTIIVIHGDHGPKMSLDQDSLKGTDVREVLPTLIAIRAPESVKVSDKMTNVNIYRNLFSAIFGDNLPPLEDRNYYSTWERPYDFVQVSETAAPRERTMKKASRAERLAFQFLLSVPLEVVAGLLEPGLGDRSQPTGHHVERFGLEHAGRNLECHGSVRRAQAHGLQVRQLHSILLRGAILPTHRVLVLNVLRVVSLLSADLTDLRHFRSLKSRP
jgi:hypothetical protein